MPEALRHAFTARRVVGACRPIDALRNWRRGALDRADFDAFGFGGVGLATRLRRCWTAIWAASGVPGLCPSFLDWVRRYCCFPHWRVDGDGRCVERRRQGQRKRR